MHITECDRDNYKTIIKTQDVYVSNDCTAALGKLLHSLAESSPGVHQKMIKEWKILSQQLQRTAELATLSVMQRPSLVRQSCAVSTTKVG